MPIALDHLIVPSRDRRAAAELLAAILAVPWSETGVGPFCPVFVSDGLTLDIDQVEGDLPVMHYCFRLGEHEFADLVARLESKGLAYRSLPHGPVDRKVNEAHGGRIVYWSEPDGHVWEALTVSYARRPVPTLFEAAGLRAVELTADDEAALQGFFESNPDYFQAVGDQPPQPSEAHEELHGPLPAGWPYTRKWVLGFRDGDGALAGTATIVSDLLAAGVWHVGLFMIASGLHGRGVARETYRALERWMQDGGARWVRLGVVVGNARGERFWQAAGFVETRLRDGIAVGARVATVRVMAKALAGGTMEQYLALVPRDRRDDIQETR